MDRLSTPVFLDFPCGSAGKESTYNVGDLGSIPQFNPWVGKIPWRMERLPTSVFWPGEFQGLYSPRVCKESDMTEQLSRSYLVQFSCSVVSASLRPPWIAAHQASLSITNSWRLLKLMSIESVMPSSHLILCRPLLLPPPIPPSIRLFSNESTLRMRWPK